MGRSLSRFLTTLACSAFLALSAQSQLTPDQVLAQMGRGINLGNTLEPPTEGAWNNGPAQEYYFDDFVAAGFKTVRLPIRWDQHTQSSDPFTIQDSWLDRVEQIVDWGLARDLVIIINGHHEDWLKQNYANVAARARYDSIWSQIAVRFRDKSDKLLFEIINEPFGMTRTQVDDLNARILGIIRRTNPTRIVVFSGNEYSGSAQMMAAAVPDDDFLMAYFHSYDPWSFAGQGEGTWGFTDADRVELSRQFESVADWSAASGVPVMISEFGAVRSADYNSRTRHYAAYVEECLEHNVACQVWDDGGDFGVYERDTRTWSEIKDILIKNFLDGPTQLGASVVRDSVVSVEWTNRSEAFSAIRVERRAGNAPFREIARLPRDATRFSDSTVAGGNTYDYRVIAESGLVEDRFSYPVRVLVRPWVRSSYGGNPAVLPGTIEAEDFDVGGEGLTYHDTDVTNIPGAYRPNEAVDVEPRNDGGFQVAYIEAGEWLEYTVDVLEAGDYTIRAYVASLDGGGRFRFEFDGRWTRTLTVPSTGDWQTLTPVTTSITLPAGRQTLRVIVFAAAPFNIDRYTFELAGTTATEAVTEGVRLDMYPNPVRQALTISYVRPILRGARAELYDVLGRQVRKVSISAGRVTLPVEDLPHGIYFVRVYDGGDLVAVRRIAHY